MPGTISEIRIARDSVLDYIHQFPSSQTGVGYKTTLVVVQSPKIPLDRLVACVNAQEAGNRRAKQYADTTYGHVIEDRGEVNYGIDSLTAA
jgi:hypothetical protein